MDTRTNLSLTLYVYPGHALWHVQSRPLFGARRLLGRGHYLEDPERPVEDPTEMLLLCALEAYRLYGARESI
jgi:hypothetical protein